MRKTNAAKAADARRSFDGKRFHMQPENSQSKGVSPMHAFDFLGRAAAGPRDHGGKRERGKNNS